MELDNQMIENSKNWPNPCEAWHKQNEPTDP